ncbi:hypothetical protein EON79_06810, partial [bacterium]
MSEPHQRRIHPVANGIPLTLAFAIGALWLAGERSGGAKQMEVDAFRVPLQAGGPAVAAIIGVILLNALFVAGETSVEALRSLHL